MEDYVLIRKQERLNKCKTVQDKFSLLYEWVKTSQVNKRQFLALLNEITKPDKMTRDILTEMISGLNKD